jgi:hypothetical protein
MIFWSRMLTFDSWSPSEESKLFQKMLLSDESRNCHRCWNGYRYRHRRKNVNMFQAIIFVKGLKPSQSHTLVFHERVLGLFSSPERRLEYARRVLDQEPIRPDTYLTRKGKCRPGYIQTLPRISVVTKNNTPSPPFSFRRSRDHSHARDNLECRYLITCSA